MSMLPGLENYHPLGGLPYDEKNIDSIIKFKRSESKNDSFNYAYIRIKEVAVKLSKLPDDYRHINRDYRSVAQVLFDLPVIFTNRASENVLNEHGKQRIRDYFIGYEPKSRVQEWRTNYGKYVVMDHEYPRAIAARVLINEYMDFHFSEDYFYDEYLNKYGLVNLVTDNENGRLGQYSKKNVFVSPKNLYQNCRIILKSLT